MKEFICNKCGKTYYTHHEEWAEQNPINDAAKRQIALMYHEAEDCLESHHKDKTIECQKCNQEIVRFAKDFATRFPIATKILAEQRKAEHRCLEQSGTERYTTCEGDGSYYDTAKISVTDDGKCFVRFGAQMCPGVVVGMTDGTTRIQINMAKESHVRKAFEYAELHLIGKEKLAVAIFPDLDR